MRPLITGNWKMHGTGPQLGEIAAIAAAIRMALALFSHGQFGSALAARWIGLAVIEAQHLALGPASISILAHEAGHPKVPVIALWNALADRSLSR